MAERHIEKEFQRFREMAIQKSPRVSEVQLSEMQKVFYAGALALLKTMFDAADADALSEQVMDDVTNELHDFAVNVAYGDRSID